MKMILGACSSAVLNISRTNLGPSPRYFWISSDPTTLKKVAEVSLATALASNVFPVPGSPYRITPISRRMKFLHLEEMDTFRRLDSNLLVNFWMR